MTTGLEGEDDMVTAPDALHLSPDTLHYAGALMAQDYGSIRLSVPVIDIADVGVADAAGDDANQDLVVPGAFHREGFRLHGAASAAQNGCPDLLNVRIGWTGHGVPPFPALERLRLKPGLFRYPAGERFCVISSAPLWSVCRVALDCIPEKINPASRFEKWGSRYPFHGLLLLEGWKVMLVG
jgi:hypothetical protein